MNITITINTDNDAFTDRAGSEVARILNNLAKQVNDWPGVNEFSIGLRDINGNKVGSCEVTK